jgi:hypothetical protein
MALTNDAPCCSCRPFDKLIVPSRDGAPESLRAKTPDNNQWMIATVVPGHLLPLYAQFVYESVYPAALCCNR